MKVLQIALPKNSTNFNQVGPEVVENPKDYA
jgi:hypothetical protein